MKVWILTVALPLLVFAQRQSGELRLQVVDPSGNPAAASGRLAGQSAGTERSFSTGEDGAVTLQVVPFGRYVLEVARPGFTPWRELVEIRSEAPRELRVTLSVAQIETVMRIVDASTLLDGERTAGESRVSAEQLRFRRSSSPARGVIEMVNTQPGWLLEANGVLHPRGSEYDVQYVIDGTPLFDNRSPSYAQSLGIEEFSSMRVLTGGYPAEYGRKLGGVIEVATERDTRKGFHGRIISQAGSFEQASGYVSGQYIEGKSTVGVSTEALTTERYLDSPVEENFSNHGSSAGFSARFEHDWNQNARTRFYGWRKRTGFLVPNELVQEAAGQRQDRTAEESLGQVSHQQIFSANTIAQLRFMGRDTAASLWSNANSIPIAPEQERGFREFYSAASLVHTAGRHEIKTGLEAIWGRVRERTGYRITAYEIGGVEVIDDDLPDRFSFSARRNSNEQSAFLQDRIRFGRLTVNAGLRWDRYSFVVNENVWSPRLAAAYHIPTWGLMLRGAYDRVFQTPAVENILLSSLNPLRDLGGEGAFLTLRPSRGNFYEGGFSKSMGGKFRLDATAYRRRITNFADDAVLFNTGVSFPIAFTDAIIKGYEAKLEMPRWGRFSGFASWANMHGVGHLPVTGGLFLGDEAEEALEGAGSFAITQDQRNTARAWLRAELNSRLWLAAGGRYNSGLPVELEGAVDEELLEQQYGEAILSRVNSARGRVRPSSAIDLSFGALLWKREKSTGRLQADVLNLTDRLNVINFSGLFSGTAIEPRRNFAVRFQMEF